MTRLPVLGRRFNGMEDARSILFYFQRGSRCFWMRIAFRKRGILVVDVAAGGIVGGEEDVILPYGMWVTYAVF